MKPKLYYPGSESQNVQEYMRSLNEEKSSHRALEIMRRENKKFTPKEYELDLRSQMN